MPKALRHAMFYIVIFFLVIVLAGTIGFDIFKKHMIAKYMANFKMPAATVETVVAKTQTWRPSLFSVGSLKATQGVNVSPEVSGQVIAIRFKSGQMVKKGQSLFQLDDAFDRSQLNNDLAALHLAKVQYQRQVTLLKTNSTSKSALDEANAKLEQMQATVAGDQVKVSKKNIRAPFSGKIGIRMVNIGEYVNAGTSLVLLQSLDPLFVDFSLPQQDLKKLHVGQAVKLSLSGYKDKTAEGRVTAINSAIDIDTRTLQVRAEVPNPKMALYPGAFSDIYVQLPQKDKVVTIPQTAVAYTLYGDSVYLIKHDGKTKDGKQILRAVRQMVTLGLQQGDQVEIKKGLQAGDEIVSAGQVKLSNNSTVIINNSMALKEGP